MVRCSVADVRAYFSPVSLSDAEVLATITAVSDDIAARSGASESSSDANLKQAEIFASVAACLRRAKNNGELAATVKKGNYQQQNAIDPDIQAYEDKSNYFLRKYLSSQMSVSIPFGRVGYGTVNSTLK